MKRVIFKISALALSLTLSSAVFAAEQTNATVSDVNCTDFSAQLELVQADSLLESVSILTANCPDFADQIVETAIALAPAVQHQDILQVAADSGSILPSDALLAAIAGGGDPATLSEPTAGGNLAIVPPSAATAPAIIGGTNGGNGGSPVASGN